jgi:hypothetical protein
MSSSPNYRSDDCLFRCDLHLDGESRRCSAPAAIMDHDGLTFIVRHHGERHRVRIPLAELQLEIQKMLTKFNEVVDTVPRAALYPP